MITRSIMAAAKWDLHYKHGSPVTHEKKVKQARDGPF
jgi:hypothetical protein